MNPESFFQLPGFVSDWPCFFLLRCSFSLLLHETFGSCTQIGIQHQNVGSRRVMANL